MHREAGVSKLHRRCFKASYIPDVRAASPLLLLLLLLLLPKLLLLALACQPVHFGADSSGQPKIACRCSDAYCDTELKFEWPRDGSSLFKLTSSLSGARFQASSVTLDELRAQQQQEEEEEEKSERKIGDGQAETYELFSVRVDIGKRFQQVVGYGGAFTDSASMLIRDKLTPTSHQQLMSSYFGQAGLNYNLARVPIGGTDMSWRPYSYNDMPAGFEDFELNNFNLQDEDLSYKLPLIREASLLRGEPLKLLASSWSAPNWMKSNGNLVQGRLKDDVSCIHGSECQKGLPASVKSSSSSSMGNNIKGGKKYYDAYARYICKFLDEYELQLAAGTFNESSSLLVAGQNDHHQLAAATPPKMWALTPQNEPCTPGRLGQSIVNYNSVNFDPSEMALFMRDHLIPQLLRNNRTSQELALFVWDDTLLGFDKYKKHLFWWGGAGAGEQQTEVSDSAIIDYVRGLALHWYSQGLDKLPYKALYDVRRWLPARFSVISTEASFIGRPQAGDWTRGEKYARDIIENLRSGSIGWIDWNLALNLEGGPTWSKNFLDAAILIDQHSGSFLKNPMFYAIGHLSRFIRARSYIVDSQVWAKFANATKETAEVLSLSSSSWRLVDELAEQTSNLLVVASELQQQQQQQHDATAQGLRQVALVLLNRATSETRVSLTLESCRSQLGESSKRLPLTLKLDAKSFTSLAFNC